MQSFLISWKLSWHNKQHQSKKFENDCLMCSVGIIFYLLESLVDSSDAGLDLWPLGTLGCSDLWLEQPDRICFWGWPKTSPGSKWTPSNQVKKKFSPSYRSVFPGWKRNVLVVFEWNSVCSWSGRQWVVFSSAVVIQTPANEHGHKL